MAYSPLNAPRRAAQLANFAQERGWRYRARGRGLEPQFVGPPFRLEPHGFVSNVLEGRYDGRDVTAFDQRVTVIESSDDYAAISMRLDVVSPMVSVTPQAVLAVVLEHVFRIGFDVGDPAFDARFRVQADSEEFARELLQPPLTSWLVAHPDRSWRLQASHLVLVGREPHTPTRLDADLASMATFLSLVPASVWSRLQE